jgi:hypothetical protein
MDHFMSRVLPYGSYHKTVAFIWILWRNRGFSLDLVLVKWGGVGVGRKSLYLDHILLKSAAAVTCVLTLFIYAELENNAQTFTGNMWFIF